MNQADLCCGKYWAGYFGVLIPTLSPKPCTWTDLGVSPKSYAKVSSFLFYFILFLFSTGPDTQSRFGQTWAVSRNII